MSRYNKAEKEARASIKKQGPCAFCGDLYAAHRVIDAQMERVIAGEGWEDVAADYDLTDEQMVLRWRALMSLYSDKAQG